MKNKEREVISSEFAKILDIAIEGFEHSITNYENSVFKPTEQIGIILKRSVKTIEEDLGCEFGVNYTSKIDKLMEKLKEQRQQYLK